MKEGGERNRKGIEQNRNRSRVIKRGKREGKGKKIIKGRVSGKEGGE